MHTALLSLVLATVPAAEEPKTIPLWPDGAPGAVGEENADKPTLTIYLPPADKATGTGVVLVPGGGYVYVSYEKEGRQPAEWLNKLGVAAFVVTYRHAPRYSYPAPMDDGKRAMRLVRANAKEYGIDPKCIGMWGFSAGGHLAATVGTQFDNGNADAKDAVEKVGCRPDFLILCYPVITMTLPETNLITRRALFGKEADEKTVDLLSAEKHVTNKTPPTFLLHGSADPIVPRENSEMFYKALQKADVPAELHILPKAKHGFALAQKDPDLHTWPDMLATWLKERGLLEKAGKRE